MQFKFNDGGREQAGYKGQTGDCVTRAIAIASGKPYQEVYDALNETSQVERIGSRCKGRSNSRTGVYRKTYEKYIESIGGKWTPTMLIGQGCKVHLRDGELPMGRLVVKVSKHLTAVLDGVINDTHDPQRHGIIVENGVTRPYSRCVYGYYTFGQAQTS